MFWGKSISDGKDAPAGQVGEMAGAGPESTWVEEEIGASVEVENCHVGLDFRHELIILFRFR